MQRLFSMFPAGRPGLALGLMRVALAVMLVEGVAGRIGHLSAWLLSVPASIALALGVGFVTPIACVASIVLEVTIWMTSDRAIEAVHICAVLNAIALFLLGPGAYSLDARLFGRRRVVLRANGDARDD